MLALCQANLGSAIPAKERYLGEVDQTDYSPLSIGGSYVVYGLLCVFERVDFLVRAPEQPPFWAPSSLFQLVDARIPAGWQLCITQTRPDYKCLFEAFKISHVIGYPLLVNEYEHYIGVVERDPVEVLRFLEEVERIAEPWG
ncbi:MULTISPECIES: hypothetical protein [Pseudomonas]|uniref:hypothetical protein n=1 Tax=Pseudomonas TaxID=286 RepID=UPI0010308242|nr:MULTISPECIES: hypothetical protein [Pseudomonas]MDY7568965.1 hypothetical protein [Pseudomonas sp. CCC4.1]MEB0144317.1 hypothetical protein [Pseudomonas sp. CCC4.1]